MADNDGKGNGLKLEMVGEGVEDAHQPDDDQGQDASSLKEEADSELEDENAEEQRLGGGEEEEDEEEAKKILRRAENKTRRERQKAARERDQKELSFLRNRNEQVERQLMSIAKRLDDNDINTVDSRLRQVDNAIANSEDVYGKATTAGEGDDAKNALKIRDDLREQRDKLIAHREVLKRKSDETAKPEEVRSPPPPELVTRLRAWHDRNKWFDFGRRDEDSAVAGAIDDMLADEGYDPTTDEYYKELDRRIARRIPDRRVSVNNDKGGGEGNGDDNRRSDKDEKKKKPSTGPKFRVGGHERALGSNQVHITKERRAAMEEAGAWEDKKLRNRMLASYAKWDEEHAND